jgi:hypothetical protein
MEEQSHKQEMAAAVRGDFERLQARRRAEDAPTAASPYPPAEAAGEDDASASEPQRSILARLLGR